MVGRRGLEPRTRGLKGVPGANSPEDSSTLRSTPAQRIQGLGSEGECSHVRWSVLKCAPLLYPECAQGRAPPQDQRTVEPPRGLTLGLRSGPPVYRASPSSGGDGGRGPLAAGCDVHNSNLDSQRSRASCAAGLRGVLRGSSTRPGPPRPGESCMLGLSAAGAASSGPSNWLPPTLLPSRG